MRQRSVDVLSLSRNGFLPVRLQVLQGAHIVQAVGQLDQDHPHV
jgi:hypothetical protein